jgi:hypothetical protein
LFPDCEIEVAILHAFGNEDNSHNSFAKELSIVYFVGSSKSITLMISGAVSLLLVELEDDELVPGFFHKTTSAVRSLSSEKITSISGSSAITDHV